MVAVNQESSLPTAVLLSDRVVQIVQVPGAASYKLQRAGLPGFGEEGQDLGPIYERVLRGYRHVAVRLVEENQPVLALEPSAENNDPFFVEVDDWAQPIPVSEDGITAVHMLEDLVRSGDRGPETHERIRAIVERSLGEAPSLRMAILDRILRHHEIPGAGVSPNLPSNVFWLLPWQERFDPYLERIADLLSGQAPVDASLRPPRLGHYFVVASPGLAPAVSDVLNFIEKGRPKEEDGPELVIVASRFVRALETVPLSRLPGTTQCLLALVVSRLIKYFERLRSKREVDLTAQELDVLLQSISALYLIFIPLREAGGHLDLQSVLYNLARALVTADAGRFLDTDPWGLGPLLPALRREVGTVPVDPAVLLADSSFKPHELLNGVVDAADIHRFYAQILFAWEGEFSKAFEHVSTSQRFYEVAKEKTTASGKVCKRFVRALLLKGEIIARLARGEAREPFLQALALLEEYATTTLPLRNQREQYSIASLKTECYMVLMRHSPTDREAFTGEVARLVREMIVMAPHEHKAWQLVLDYHLEVEADLSAALTLIDRWIASWKAASHISRSRRKSLEWLQYQGAHLAMRDPAFAVEAIERYVEVLRDQLLNTTAMEDLLGLLWDLPETLLPQAKLIVDRTLTDVADADCPLTHAVIRVLFLADGLRIAKGDLTSAQALVALTLGDVEAAEHARARLREMMDKTPSNRKFVCIILDHLSRGLVQRGRSYPFGPDLEAADRILDFALEALQREQKGEKTDHNELIWRTRKLEISMRSGRWESAESMAEVLYMRFPADPIIRLKTAMIKIKRGYLEDAEDILRDTLVFGERNGGRRPHPAILDRLAHVALCRAQFGDAEELYRTILDENPLDATAHFGLGRVFFEQGRSKWGDALGEWIQALRLRSYGGQTDGLLSWLTAGAIVGLFGEGSHGKHTADEAFADERLLRLERALRDEGDGIATRLVGALSARGMVDRRVVASVMSATNGRTELSLRRRVAQYLMARSIHVVVRATEDGEPDEIGAYVSWAHQRGLLAEYLAGAKGSYARALLRLALDATEIPSMAAAAQGFERSLDSQLLNLYLHIRNTDYSARYYADADRLALEAGRRSVGTWTNFARGLIQGVAARATEQGTSADDLLHSLTPAVGLWPLAELLSIKNGTSTVGGWVDRDVLLLAENRLGINGWRATFTGAERDVGPQQIPTEQDVDIYCKSGLYFRHDTGSRTGSLCYIEAIPDYETRLAFVS